MASWVEIWTYQVTVYVKYSNTVGAAAAGVVVVTTADLVIIGVVAAAVVLVFVGVATAGVDVVKSTVDPETTCAVH